MQQILGSFVCATKAEGVIRSAGARCVCGSSKNRTNTGGAKLHRRLFFFLPTRGCWVGRGRAVFCCWADMHTHERLLSCVLSWRDIPAGRSDTDHTRISTTYGQVIPPSQQSSPPPLWHSYTCMWFFLLPAVQNIHSHEQVR